MNAKAWKAVHVLAGSIVEAVLIDSLESVKCKTSKPLNEMVLGELIPLAKAEKLLDDETIDLTTVIRKYRNLIHPGRVTRLEKRVEETGAVIATQVVELVIREVAESRRENYGFTAEQLLRKLQSGVTALPLVKHLVNDSSELEVLRLLTEVLPERYIDALADVSVTSAYIDLLRQCYWAVFDAAPETCRIAATKRFVSICRDEPEWRVLIHEENFFRCYDLKYLTPEEQEIVKLHILARVKTDVASGKNRTFRGIGPYLLPEEAENFFWDVYGHPFENEGGEAEFDLLRAEYRLMNKDCRKAVMKACSLTMASTELKRYEQFVFGDEALGPDDIEDWEVPF